MSNWIEDFIQCAQINSTDTMEYYDDITQTREYNEPQLQHVRKIIDSVFNEFCYSNGLFNRISNDKLTDSQCGFLRLLGWDLPVKNRYIIKMINYYIEKFNKRFNEFDFEEDFKELINDIYSGTPCVYVQRTKGLLPKESIKEVVLPTDNPLIQHTSEFIKIGQSIQFDIEGFPRNQLMYLLCGVIVCDVGNTDHRTFRELIQHIINYLHIIFTTKAFDLSKSIKQEKYNLITFTEFKRDGKITPNHRYQCAKKYFVDVSFEGNSQQTKYVSDEKGSYILTEYETKDEIDKKWKQLEELYFDHTITDELISVWFDSQLLTRSTCLVGVLLIILNYGIIKFKKDEMPDWKAISGKKYIDTFERISQIRLKVDTKEFTVKNVIGLLNNYVGLIKQMK
jgi:hypothetical protein